MTEQTGEVVKTSAAAAERTLDIAEAATGAGTVVILIKNGVKKVFRKATRELLEEGWEVVDEEVVETATQRASRGTASADDLVDLTTPEGRRHILEGDATGGGHRPGVGLPRKSEFPVGWSDDQIIHAISDVATDPAAVRSAGRGGRTIVTGMRDGVEIRVVLEADGTIVTGFPTNLPRNP